MPLRLALFAALVSLVVPACAQTEAVQEIGLCQLKHNALAYDHKIVKVRGTVDLQFEDFSLYDPECSDYKLTSVWLTFGGDVSDIAVYCCGDHSRSAGHDLKIDGQIVPILKDASYEEFYKLLRASRNRMPDGQPCTSDCHFYSVSATLTGLFLPEKQTEKERIGYGHLGCCSLLIIERVSNVTAAKTSVPLGAFNCEKSDWKVTTSDLPALEPYVQCSSHCDEQTGSLLKRVAAHWGDSIVVADGNTTGSFSDTSGPHPVDHLNWLSNDMLTSYVMLADETKPATLSVAREVCRPVNSASPPKLPISCDEYATTARWTPERERKFKELLDNDQFVLAEQMTADAAEELSSQGDQSWRTKTLPVAAHEVLARQLAHWSLVPDSTVRAGGCPDPQKRVDDDRYLYTSCSWYSLDGMQEFGVSLMTMPNQPPNDSHYQWLLPRADARICHEDPSIPAGIVH